MLIDERPTETISDLKKALDQMPDDSPYEVIVKHATGTFTGKITSFASVHQATRPGQSAIVEIVVQG